jgi:hypothetical protein
MFTPRISALFTTVYGFVAGTHLLRSVDDGAWHLAMMAVWLAGAGYFIWRAGAVSKGTQS